MRNRIDIAVIADEILDVGDPSKKIKILNHYLKKGYRIKPKQAVEYIIDSNRSCPEFIEFYIQHPACTTIHLIHFFKEFISDHEMHYAAFCLKQEKFTHDRKVYQEHASESFSDTVYKFVSSYPTINPTLSHIHHVENLFTLLFKNYQTMLKSNDLDKFSDLFIEKYNSTQENIANYSKANYYIDTAADQIQASIFQQALLHIVSHPEYQYLPSSEPNDNRTRLDYPWEKYKYPFYFAAHNGCKEIFSYFYCHEDTPSSERIKAITLLKKAGHEKLLISILEDSYKLYYEKNVSLFILISNQQLNHDLKYYIFDTFIQLTRDKYISLLRQTNESPTIHNHHSAFFQKQPISHEWLITRALVKIKDYIYHANRAKTININKGHNRSVSFSRIFENKTLSTDFKMLALYALMHERSANPFKKLEIQKCVEPAIAPYLTIIENTAMQYAERYQQNLENLADNLIELIHRKNPENVMNLIGDHFFDEIREDTLLDIIKSDDENQNCLVM